MQVIKHYIYVKEIKTLDYTGSVCLKIVVDFHLTRALYRFQQFQVGLPDHLQILTHYFE